MSTEQQINYAEVLADLEAKRAALDKAIEAIRPLVGQSFPTPSSASGSDEGGGAPPIEPAGQVKPDAFFRMTIPDAAHLYLSTIRRKRTTAQIAEVLLAGGIHSRAQRFPRMVYNILDRDPRFTRLGKEWALSEWVPGGKKTKKGKATDAEGPSSDMEATSSNGAGVVA